MVINAAGVAGQPEIIQAAIEKLRCMNVALQEYHVAPLMAAFTFHCMIPEALDLFEFMEVHRIQPTRFTARPLMKLLLEEDNLQLAISHLRARTETKGRNLASTFNCILAATLKDNSTHTMALGKEMDDLKVTPTVDTYNILIHAACLRRSTEAAHAYYEELLEKGIEPNKETYERIIVLLTSEPAYDDAFLYLHRMTSAHIVPSAEMLTGLAKKCSIRFDARWKQLVRQMEKHNYNVSDELMEFLVTNGRAPTTEPLSTVNVEEDASTSQDDALYPLCEFTQTCWSPSDNVLLAPSTTPSRQKFL
jgi:pentatricopeptide repeat protein